MMRFEDSETCLELILLRKLKFLFH